MDFHDTHPIIFHFVASQFKTTLKVFLFIFWERLEKEKYVHILFYLVEIDFIKKIV